MRQESEIVQTARTKKASETPPAYSRCLIPHIFNDSDVEIDQGTKLFWLVLPLALVAAGFLALMIDCPLGRWCVEKNCPAWIENLLTTIEPFGNGLGVAIIGITIFFLDPRRRVALFRVLACAYSAGLAANGLKLLLSRARPHSFDFHSGVLGTFGDWLPGFSAGSTGQSFPSGHTTTAVALAAALVWMYPRGKYLFPVFALLIGCQRVQSGAHFPSDVLWGAALGSLIALLFLKIGRLPGWLDAWENKMGMDNPPRQ